MRTFLFKFMRLLTIISLGASVMYFGLLALSSFNGSGPAGQTAPPGSAGAR